MPEESRKIFLDVQEKITIVINLYSNYHLRIKENKDIFCNIKKIGCFLQTLSEGTTSLKKGHWF